MYKYNIFGKYDHIYIYIYLPRNELGRWI